MAEIYQVLWSLAVHMEQILTYILIRSLSHTLYCCMQYQQYRKYMYQEITGVRPVTAGKYTYQEIIGVRPGTACNPVCMTA